MVLIVMITVLVLLGLPVVPLAAWVLLLGVAPISSQAPASVMATAVPVSHSPLPSPLDGQGPVTHP